MEIARTIHKKSSFFHPLPLPWWDDAFNAHGQKKGRNNKKRGRVAVKMPRAPSCPPSCPSVVQVPVNVGANRFHKPFVAFLDLGLDRVVETVVAKAVEVAQLVTQCVLDFFKVYNGDLDYGSFGKPAHCLAPIGLGW